jgi:Domain of unknown function (DUF4178)
MLTWLILSAAIAALGGGTIAVYRAAGAGAKRDKQLAAPPKERGIRDLLPGDVISYGNKDFLVEGIMSYDEDGHTWTAARMLDDGVERWIMVGMERQPGLTSPVRFLEKNTTLQISGYPPDQIEVDGESYRMSGRGNAGISAKGDIGIEGLGKSLLRVRYWRYTAPGDKLVIVEQWGPDFRVISGKAIPEHMFNVLAAS